MEYGPFRTILQIIRFKAMAKRSKQKKTLRGEESARTPKKAEAASLPQRFHQDWIPGLLLLLAVFLAYQPVWQAGFIWDDDGRVTANPCIVGPLGLKEIWTTSAADLCP